MKKYSTFLSIAFLSITLGFSSCSKADDNTVSNSLIFEGSEFILAKGFLEPFGSNGNGSFDFDVTLVSSGISNTEDGLGGKGELVYLDLNTGTSSGLEEGTYTYSSERGPFTFVDAIVLIGYDLDTGIGDNGVDATGGTVEVKISEFEVEISFDLERLGGDNITGTFKGELEDI